METRRDYESMNNKIKKTITTFSLLIIFATTAKTNNVNYYFRSIDTSCGLSQNTVTSILQDKMGFMWFGTKDGLNRYNGLTFRTFSKSNSALGNNFITTLLKDNTGNIWIGTDYGVYLYNIEKDVIQRCPHGVDRIKGTINSMACDNNGCIYIASGYDGIYKYDRKRQTVKKLFVRPLKGKNVTHLWFNNQRLWIGVYGDDIYYTDNRQTSLTPFRDGKGQHTFAGTDVHASLVGKRKMYVGTASGLYETDIVSKTTRKIIGNYVRDLRLKTPEELWIGTESGVFIYHISTGTTEHISASETDDRYALSDNAIYSLYCDREHGMWIGSYFGGINYYLYQNNYFEKYYPRDDLGFFGKRIREICAGVNGTLWIGTEDNGLFRFNKKTKDIVPFTNPSLYHNIHGLCRDGNTLWVGTFSGGLAKIDLQTNTIRKIYRKGTAENTLNANDIFSICRTRKGELWIGTTSGLLKYNRKTDDFIRIHRFDKSFIYHIMESHDGTLWLSTYSSGLITYNTATNKVRHFWKKEDDNRSLPDNKVISTFEDSHNRIWIMTQGNGVCLLDKKSGRFSTFSFGNKMGGNTVYKMEEDNNGELWLSTSKGLICLNTKTMARRVYTTANGLISNQFNYQSGFKDDDGTLYFGSINGFVSFNPSKLSVNKIIPALGISDFYLSNRLIQTGDDSPLKQNISLSDEIELSANQNTLSLSAAVLSYQSPQTNTLLYKLDGLETDWHTLGQNGTIQYSNLPSGHYTLRIKGANSDGTWNPAERTLDIHVRPPFYLSFWAYLIYIMMLAYAFSQFIKFMHRRNQKRYDEAMKVLEHEKEKELYTSKIDFFTNVAHEIRTPLTLIKSPLESVLASGNVSTDVREDLEIMDLNTNRLVDLINQLLDFRKTEKESVKLNFIKCSIPELVNQVFTEFKSVARQNGIQFTLNCPTVLDASIDKEVFTKITSNLYVNAIKFASSFINSYVSVEDTTMKFVIENDGKVVPLSMREEIFRPFAQYKNDSNVNGTGLGLALARSLAELHGGMLYMDEDLDCNRFILSLPLHQQDVLTLYTETTKTTDVAQVQESNRKCLTIMFVDDNRDLQMFIKRKLGTEYNILIADNGKIALEMLKSNATDLIISDIMMPEIDGLELCDILKSDVEYSHIPMILLTAKTTQQSRIEGLRCGADAYIEKPFSMEYLKTNIESLLENRQKLYASFAHSPFTKVNTLAITKADENFLKHLNDIISINMPDPDFGLSEMAEAMNMSRSSLNRKIKGILDLTPNDYVRIERLKKAARLLQDGEYKINEVCYMVGFNTPSYFAKCFQKQFGMLPKEFIK